MPPACGFHVQTLIIYKLGFNQNYHTFDLKLLIQIVLCTKFPWTKFINYKCFDMRLPLTRALARGSKDNCQEMAGTLMMGFGGKLLYFEPS